MLPLYAWSNAWRPMPFMDELEDENFQGHLPIVYIAEAVVRLGWRGPFSYEVFYEEWFATIPRSLRGGRVPPRGRTRSSYTSLKRVCEVVKS
ncbi:hypothetical protein DENSPDRAFT_614224 [Dentipellis sp. KUC8613]|nr:hypothetical protein DENSPDRAFT_614224 [Dentipellis sp. KUC8613]